LNSEAVSLAIGDDLSLLSAVLESLAVGVAVCNGEGALTYVNPEAERILGYGLTETSTGEWSSVYGCFLPDRVTPYPPETLPLARAARGEEVRHELVFIRNPKQPKGVWIEVSGRPLMGGDGAPRGGVVVFTDVTEPQNRLRGRASADGAGDSFVPFRRVYDQLARAVEHTGDTVVITDSNGVIEYVNPAFEETTGFSAVEVLGQTPRMLKSGKHDEQFYRELWSLLRAGKTFRGTIVNRKKSGELYWAEQTISPIKDGREQITHFVSVLKDITAMRDKQEHEFCMQVAREVQQRYFNTTATLAGFDIAGAAYPADQTGGDYFDFLPRPDGSLYLVVADVTGHGLGSALLMAETRACLRAYATVATGIASLLASLNQTLAPDLGGAQFVTLLLARIDPRERTIEYLGAGHEPCYVLRRSGETVTMSSTAPPLGLFGETEFGPSQTISLEHGDTIVLLTDGVSETFSADGTPFDANRALEYVRSHSADSAAEILRGVYECARAFANGEPQRDDLTLVVCKVE
jgi:PAS domain S-box-containing protein